MMCSFTCSANGVSGRLISSRKTGTSGPYFVAMGTCLAAGLWIGRPVVGEVRDL